MYFLVKVLKRTRITTLHIHLLATDDCLKKIGLLLSSLTDLIVILLSFELSLLSFAKLIDLLHLKGFSYCASSILHLFFHQGKLTLVLFIVGTWKTFKTLLHIITNLCNNILRIDHGFLFTLLLLLSPLDSKFLSGNNSFFSWKFIELGLLFSKLLLKFLFIFLHLHEFLIFQSS